MSKTFLVTGAAGFIGSHVTQRLLERGDTVVGIDNLNDYYDPARKQANLAEVRAAVPGAPFYFKEIDIRDRDALNALFAEYEFAGIAHLAAMAGVRASIDDPELYYDVNLKGTLNLLDASVGRLGVKRDAPATFAFAATSSAYGNTTLIPFVETDPCNGPLAPYSSSKRAAELLGHTYHYLHGAKFTALRFFNVYGPRGRPDMMPYKLLDSIFRGTQIPLYNNGQMHRDWTYVDDIVSGVVGALDFPQDFEVINLGRGRPILTADFVTLMEQMTGKKANLVSAPKMDADVDTTFADVSKARQLLGYDPQVTVEDGVRRFYEWFKTAILGE